MGYLLLLLLFSPIIITYFLPVNLSKREIIFTNNKDSMVKLKRINKKGNLTKTLAEDFEKYGNDLNRFDKPMRASVFLELFSKSPFVNLILKHKYADDFNWSYKWTYNNYVFYFNESIFLHVHIDDDFNFPYNESLKKSLNKLYIDMKYLYDNNFPLVIDKINNKTDYMGYPDSFVEKCCKREWVNCHVKDDICYKFGCSQYKYCYRGSLIDKHYNVLLKVKKPFYL